VTRYLFQVSELQRAPTYLDRETRATRPSHPQDRVVVGPGKRVRRVGTAKHACRQPRDNLDFTLQLLSAVFTCVIVLHHFGVQDKVPVLKTSIVRSRSVMRAALNHGGTADDPRYFPSFAMISLRLNVSG
jgi:hypothetical protein